MNGRFGALGHGISDSDTGDLVESSEGALYSTEIMGTISLYKNLAYLLRFVKRFLLFSNHNLTILLKTRNSVLDKVSHSILSQPIHIVFFLYLLQCFGTCSIHISIFCIFEFDYNSLIFFIKRFLISLFGIVRRYFPLSVRP